MDITNNECAEKCVKKMLEKWKGIDVLVNNAAV